MKLIEMEESYPGKSYTSFTLNITNLCRRMLDDDDNSELSRVVWERCNIDNDWDSTDSLYGGDLITSYSMDWSRFGCINDITQDPKCNCLMLLYTLLINNKDFVNFLSELRYCVKKGTRLEDYILSLLVNQNRVKFGYIRVGKAHELANKLEHIVIRCAVQVSDFIKTHSPEDRVDCYAVCSKYLRYYKIDRCWYAEYPIFNDDLTNKGRSRDLALAMESENKYTITYCNFLNLMYGIEFECYNHYLKPRLEVHCVFRINSDQQDKIRNNKSVYMTLFDYQRLIETVQLYSIGKPICKVNNNTISDGGPTQDLHFIVSQYNYATVILPMIRTIIAKIIVAENQRFHEYREQIQKYLRDFV